MFSYRKCFLFFNPGLSFRVAINFWFLVLPHNSKNTGRPVISQRMVTMKSDLQSKAFMSAVSEAQQPLSPTHHLQIKFEHGK